MTSNVIDTPCAPWECPNKDARPISGMPRDEYHTTLCLLEDTYYDHCALNDDAGAAEVKTLIEDHIFRNTLYDPTLDTRDWGIADGDSAILA